MSCGIEKQAVMIVELVCVADDIFTLAVENTLTFPKKRLGTFQGMRQMPLRIGIRGVHAKRPVPIRLWWPVIAEDV